MTRFFDRIWKISAQSLLCQLLCVPLDFNCELGSISQTGCKQEGSVRQKWRRLDRQRWYLKDASISRAVMIPRVLLLIFLTKAQLRNCSAASNLLMRLRNLQHCSFMFCQRPLCKLPQKQPGSFLIHYAQFIFNCTQIDDTFRLHPLFSALKTILFGRSDNLVFHLSILQNTLSICKCFLKQISKKNFSQCCEFKLTGRTSLSTCSLPVC